MTTVAAVTEPLSADHRQPVESDEEQHARRRTRRSSSPRCPTRPRSPRAGAAARATEIVAPARNRKRQRAGDQRAVLGGVLRRAGARGPARRDAWLSQDGKPLVRPGQACARPFSHRVRIGRGGARRLNAIVRRWTARGRALRLRSGRGLPQALAILAAGLAAGTINTVVGSGSLITFPVLLAFGYAPVTANVSNNVGLVPGSISGVVGYRRELRGQRDRARLARPRVARRRAARCGAPAGPPRLLVRGDRARLHRDRPGARRAAAAPGGDAARRQERAPRARRAAWRLAGVFGTGRVRRLLRRRAGHPAARRPRAHRRRRPPAPQRPQERAGGASSTASRRSSSCSSPTSPGHPRR